MADRLRQTTNSSPARSGREQHGDRSIRGRSRVDSEIVDDDELEIDVLDDDDAIADDVDDDAGRTSTTTTTMILTEDGGDQATEATKATKDPSPPADDDDDDDVVDLDDDDDEDEETLEVLLGPDTEPTTATPRARARGDDSGDAHPVRASSRVGRASWSNAVPSWPTALQ